MAHDTQTRQDQLILELSAEGLSQTALLERLRQRDYSYWNEDTLRRHLRELEQANLIPRVTEDQNALVQLIRRETKYQIAERLTRVALAHLTTDNQRAFTAPQLFEWIEQEYVRRYPHVNLSLDVYRVYLTKMTYNPDSRVAREPGRFGYILNPDFRELGEEEGGEPAQRAKGLSPEQIGITERALYKPLANWLQSLGYRTRVTADEKAGGPWGNPDVVGAILHQSVWTAFDVEIVTIEAKVDTKNWRRWIFEAIAHKRFSDRSYFAFPFVSSVVSISLIEDMSEMKAYAERYKLGILVVFVNPDEYERLKKAGAEEPLLDASQIVEAWPGLYDPAPMREKDTFLRKVCGLSQLEDLYTELDEADASA